VRIEAIDAISQVEPISRLLQQAWEPPCLYYTPEYLRWQFRFPASTPAISYAAYEEEAMIGFMGAIPRRLQLGPVHSEAYIVSFFAILPGWRPTLVPASLYAKMLAAFRQANVPIIGFAIPGQGGERIAARAYPAARFGFQTLGPFLGYGYRPCPPGPSAGVEVRETTDLDLLASAAEACVAERLLCNVPNRSMLAHYLKDPQPRIAVSLHGTDGEPIGAAMIVRTTIVTPQRHRTVTTVDNLFLPSPTAEALSALCDYASRCWAEPGTARTVVLPNLWGIGADVLQVAGLRHNGGRFMGYACAPDPQHPFLRAEGTNLEIV